VELRHNVDIAFHIFGVTSRVSARYRETEEILKPSSAKKPGMWPAYRLLYGLGPEQLFKSLGALFEGLLRIVGDLGRRPHSGMVPLLHKKLSAVFNFIQRSPI
jgi:hypothetical protein